MQVYRKACKHSQALETNPGKSSTGGFLDRSRFIRQNKKRPDNVLENKLKGMNWAEYWD